MTEQTSTATCKYPGCQNPPRSAGAEPGRPPQYCADTAHTASTAWRERKRLADAERGTVTSDAEAEAPVTMARLTGTDLLRSLRAETDKVAGIAERLREAIATAADPASAEAEIETIRAAARQQAATAEARAAAAEQRAGEADEWRADADAAAEDMAAQLAAEQARVREAHEQLAEATAAHAAELDRIREETQARITIAEEDRDSAIARAEADKAAGHRRAEQRAPGARGDRAGRGRGRGPRPHRQRRSRPGRHSGRAGRPAGRGRRGARRGRTRRDHAGP